MGDLAIINPSGYVMWSMYHNTTLLTTSTPLGVYFSDNHGTLAECLRHSGHATPLVRVAVDTKEVGSTRVSFETQKLKTTFILPELSKLPPLG